MRRARALIVVACVGALAACKPAPPAVPKPAPASRDVAMTCIQNNDLACAEANLRGYLKQYPADSESNAVLGIVLSRAGKHRESLPFHAKAVEGGEATYDLFAAYAISLDATGDLAGAIAYNRKALEMVPSLVDVRGDLARQLVRSGKPEEAVELLRSFDDELENKGHPRYFTVQIEQIEARMK